MTRKNLFPKKKAHIFKGFANILVFSILLFHQRKSALKRAYIGSYERAGRKKVVKIKPFSFILRDIATDDSNWTKIESIKRATAYFNISRLIFHPVRKICKNVNFHIIDSGVKKK